MDGPNGPHPAPQPSAGRFRRSRSTPAFELLSRSRQHQPPWLAVLAAVTAPVLLVEALLLGLGAEDLAHLALLLDDHVAALRHAEGLLEQPEMVEFGLGRVLERLEP